MYYEDSKKVKLKNGGIGMAKTFNSGIVNEAVANRIYILTSFKRGKNYTQNTTYDFSRLDEKSLKRKYE